MESRGQKRTEATEELPADKRACNSLEFRPSSSNSSPQTPMSTAHEDQDTDMETSSSTSESPRSEGDGEKESVYGSCDSDNSTRDYYRNRLVSDQSKFKKVLSSLSEEVDESGQLALLTELCELLSFCSDSSLSSLMVDSYAPILIRLASHETNPDIMLLAIRAITYLCDANPRSSFLLVRYDVVSTLCQRLMAIEFLDVAEQCLQALEKISREQPLPCLRSGAIMAALSYIDFFSTSVQRVALSTVVNICKKLSSESPSLFMEAVPILCNLLQYEDRQLVESVATCLIKIGDQVYRSPDMLDEICKHGLVQHTLHHIGVNSRTTLCQPTYIGLIGLLVKLAAGSAVASRTFFELNISNICKEMLSTYDLSTGMQPTLMVDGHRSRIHEVLKLLNELLPTPTSEQEGQQKSEKEAFLLDHPDVLQKFGADLLPILIQVVDSGVNPFICYGCLSVINKLVHFTTSDGLNSLQQTANFPSFLAGVFTRKDHHVILLALEIVDAIMIKLPHVYLNSFIKEGVLFAIHSLSLPEKDLKLSIAFNGMQMENDATRKSSNDVNRCPCFAFNIVLSSKSPENGTCKLQKDTIQNLAKRIWISYFETESVSPEKGVTDTLQKLRNLSTALTALVEDATCSQHEEDIYDLLHQIMLELKEKDSISTFEFVESGIIKALVSYLSNGSHHDQRVDVNSATIDICTMEKRFEVFGQLLMSCTDSARDEFPILTLIQRLQNALSSVENFPVITNHSSKRRNSYATVPYGRSTSYPCLKVQFVREKEEICLRDYAEDIVHVDPFVPVDEIEKYLLPRVRNDKTKNVTLVSKDSMGKDSPCSHSPLDSSICEGKSAEVIAPTEMIVDVGERQESRPDLLSSSPAETSGFAQRTMDSAAVTDVQTDPVDQEEHNSLHEDGGTSADHPGGCHSEDTSTDLVFYLEGKQLNSELTLYQSILKQQIVTEHDGDVSNISLWNRVHKITYQRRVARSHEDSCHHEAICSVISEKASSCPYTPYFCRMFVSESDFENYGPVYDALSLLKSLEGINRLRFHLMSREETRAFAEGKIDDLDKLNAAVYEVQQNEFVNKKLTEKVEQQMRDPNSVSVGALPAWYIQLMDWCPFVFGFEARCNYFRLAGLGQLPTRTHPTSHGNAGSSSGRHQNQLLPRKKILVNRDKILESAAKMMELHSNKKVLLEVEYNEEVGTGLGPTLEFHTLVCSEFQRSGLGMWRDDLVSEADDSELIVAPSGLFPRPWLSTSSSTVYSQAIKKFSLLGYLVAKALQDGRVLDLPLSKALYKLILGKELTIYDIQSFDPAFGRALLEFKAVVERKKYLESLCEEKSHALDVRLRNTKIEYLCLDFSLPGYPDYVLVSGTEPTMVNLYNLEEYVTLVVDAITKSGIAKQLEAFESGFNQVFPIRHIEVFTEEELERLLCGEPVMWNSDELLDHIKFDHGYTVSSPPILNLLEIMQEFDVKQQRAFMQFVSGSPRLPTGGLASLKPNLTIVRKHCSNGIDTDLPSVMTCANYLKLPPYSSKETMKEKLLYAITEGQGSFHLS